MRRQKIKPSTRYDGDLHTDTDKDRFSEEKCLSENCLINIYVNVI